MENKVKKEKEKYFALKLFKQQTVFGRKTKFILTFYANGRKFQV